MVKFPAGDWMSVAEAAKVLDVSHRRVQALAKAGRIRSTKVFGRFLLLHRASVLKFKPKKVGRPKSSSASPRKPRKGKS